jgi:hypothetical protein
MFFSGRNGYRNLSSAFTSCVAFLLLLVYFVGSIEFNSIHSLLHSTHDAELHSEENEKEACHQAIYHQADNGCNHKTHLVSNDKCPLCHLSIHSEHWFTKEGVVNAVCSGKSPEVDLVKCFLTSYNNNLQARAPPVC